MYRAWLRVDDICEICLFILLDIACVGFRVLRDMSPLLAPMLFGRWCSSKAEVMRARNMMMAQQQQPRQRSVWRQMG